MSTQKDYRNKRSQPTLYTQYKEGQQIISYTPEELRNSMPLERLEFARPASKKKIKLVTLEDEANLMYVDVFG